MKYKSVLTLWLFCAGIESFSQDNTNTPTITSDLASMPNTTIVYYDITGSTAKELREQLNLLRPQDPNDTSQYDARTTWTFSWGWPGRGTTACDVSRAFVLFEIKVALPRWTPPRDASEALVARWQDYMQALEAHEKSHADNVVAHYSAVLSAIRNANCLTAEDSAETVLEQIRRQEAFYDSVTNHGANRGAKFP